MGELGYGTRGPILSKLKQLLADIQNVYESFLDAQTLYEQGKLDEREFFTKSGEFLKAFASLGFLTVKAVLELDAAISKDNTSKKPVAVTIPSPTLRPEMMGQASKPMYKQTESTDSKFCVQCSAKIPETAKFCTSCGKAQG